MKGADDKHENGVGADQWKEGVGWMVGILFWSLGRYMEAREEGVLGYFLALRFSSGEGKGLCSSDSSGVVIYHF